MALPIVPLVLKLASYWSTIKPLVKLVKGNKETNTKGLISSKTARFVSGSLGIKALIATLPISIEWKLYLVFGFAAVEWAVSIYLRVITKDKVG